MMYCDTMDTRYLLGGEETSRVGRGDKVSGGDVIATGPAPPAIIAFAATLHLSAATARDAIARFDGTVCSVGDMLGSRRSGLITRNVSAPTRGTVQCLPQSGTVIVRSERAAREQRARYGGIVNEVSAEAIVIRSVVARCGYAYATNVRDIGPLQIKPALLNGEFPDSGLPEPSASIIAAHIADVARLSSLMRSFQGTLIVGSVSESVMSALFARSHLPASRRTKGPGIVVLCGVGDRSQGIQAVAPFQDFNGAQTLLNRFTQTVTLILPTVPITDSTSPLHTIGIRSAI